MDSLLALVDQVQFFPWLEPDRLAGSDGDFRTRTGVAADAGFARAYVEDAEAPEFDTLSGSQRFLQAFKDGVDRCLCLIAGEARSFNHPMHDVLLDQGILQSIGSALEPGRILSAARSQHCHLQWCPIKMQVQSIKCRETSTDL